MRRIILNSLLLPFAALAAPDPALDRAAFEEAAAGPLREVFVDPGTGDWQENWFLDGEIGAVEKSRAGNGTEGRGRGHSRTPTI